MAAPDDLGEVTAHLRPGYLSGCPIQPLGITYDHTRLTSVYHYAVRGRPHRSLRAQQHGRGGLASLFAAFPDELRRLWPKRNRQGIVVGWDHLRASETLMGACSRCGIIDPTTLDAKVIPLARRRSAGSDGPSEND